MPALRVAIPYAEIWLGNQDEGGRVDQVGLGWNSLDWGLRIGGECIEPRTEDDDENEDEGDRASEWLPGVVYPLGRKPCAIAGTYNNWTR